MPRENFLAFDDTIEDTQSTYSSTELNNALGAYDAFVLQVVTDDVVGATAITVQLEVSSDGRRWASKNVVPEVNAAALATGVTNNAQGFDAGTTGVALGLVRLRVQLTNFLGGVTRAHVKIYVRAGEAVGPFQPNHLGGAILWLRADLGIVSSGGALSRWADQSGNANDALQATAANQPAVTTSDPNFSGMPTVSCTMSGGNARFLKTNAFPISLSGDMTVFAVARSPGSGASNRYLFDSLDPVAQVAMYRDTAGSSMYAYTLAGGNYISYGGSAGTPAAMILTAKTGTAARLRVNSSTPNQITSGDPGAFTATGLTIGSYAGAGPYSDWDIAEFAVWGRQLAPTEVQLLNAYASSRYGLSIA